MGANGTQCYVDVVGVVLYFVLFLCVRFCGDNTTYIINTVCSMLQCDTCTALV